MAKSEAENRVCLELRKVTATRQPTADPSTYAQGHQG
jgi:hypothetical protein